MDMNEMTNKLSELISAEHNLEKPSPYVSIGRYVNAWLRDVNGCLEECIVRIKLKYEFEKEWRYSNCVYDDGSWDYDWWEGEQEVYVEGIIPIGEIGHFMSCTDADGHNFAEGGLQ